MELRRPSSVEEAVASLGNGSIALSGGTEVEPLLRHGLLRADTLVDVRRVVPKGIRDGVIGAGTTLAEIEVDPQVPDALREACRLAASPQLRNMGSLGGNLLQATRCWYWRLGWDCWLRGGEVCYAKRGEHREHAILGHERCASAHPSDVAAALLALGATVRTSRRELPLGELYRLPTDDDRDVVSLAPDELILELVVPTPRASVYLKAMDRRRWAFPLVGVAAARLEDGTLRFALAGVAPIPWALADESALDQAEPLPQTAYKLQIARALIERATKVV